MISILLGGMPIDLRPMEYSGVSDVHWEDCWVMLKMTNLSFIYIITAHSNYYNIWTVLNSFYIYVCDLP